MSSHPPPDDSLPVGYRPAIVTAVSVVLTFSLVYFRFIVFELDTGAWTPLWSASALVQAGSIGLQFLTLWRAVQLADDHPVEYGRTVRWFGRGILCLGASLLLSTLASLSD